jgi:putative SOS response-associated peptidase YedK
MINARSETLLEKPSFKQAIEKGTALKLNPYQNFSFTVRRHS